MYSRVPLSERNFTYVFTPQNTIRPLFDDLDLDFPQALQRPLNFSDVVDPNDTLPSGLDKAGISIGGASVSHHWTVFFNDFEPTFLSQVLE